MRKIHKDVFLKKHNIKLGFMSAFVKAAAHALTDQPAVNAGMTTHSPSTFLYYISIWFSPLCGRHSQALHIVFVFFLFHQLYCHNVFHCSYWWYDQRDCLQRLCRHQCCRCNSKGMTFESVSLYFWWSLILNNMNNPFTTCICVGACCPSDS